MLYKVVSVVGARPNFVKLAGLDPVLRERFEHYIIHTGQHYDYEMSRVFFDQLKIPEPHRYLGVGSGTHGYQVGEAIKRVEEAILELKPDIVLVYGDTNSTLAGAIAAVKAGFRVGHVEAGLRVFDYSVPEEVNRRVVDAVSSILFAPTKTAFNNLIRESVPGKTILTGDIHVDVLTKWLKTASESSSIIKELGIREGEYVVATIHRAENTDNYERMKNISKLLIELSKDMRIVFPIHPRTMNVIKSLGLEENFRRSNILLIKPLGYLDFLKLLMHARLVVTDSGGVQREAYLLRVPVFILREYTEWVELLETGWAKLLDPRKPLDAKSVLDYYPRGYVEGLLGGEGVALRIANSIEEYLHSVS